MNGDLGDTIVAVAAAGGARVIVRISGDAALSVCGRILAEPLGEPARGIYARRIRPAAGLEIDARLYVFRGPRSYTGEDVVEIHFAGSRVVADAVLTALLEAGGAVRTAGPGEFTARAYLNGKMDLSQAEAVAELVAGSNRFQLAAAQRLLAGRLSETATTLREQVVDVLSLVEAALDFSEEDIEFITPQEAIGRLRRIRESLAQLLAGSIQYEAAVNMPSVGIAGAANAGKSSLLNALLGRQRSIVSRRPRTTRDVLSGPLALGCGECVLFDCAGLVVRCEGILDELAQAAAIGALNRADVVVFCVDVSKAGYEEDLRVRALVGCERLIYAATKADLVDGGTLPDRLQVLEKMFAGVFTAVSAISGDGLEALKEQADGELLAASRAAADGGEAVAMTARHRAAVNDAADDVGRAIDELADGHDEVAAMLLRSAHQSLTAIETPGGGNIDEHVLSRIFGRFCVGK